MRPPSRIQSVPGTPFGLAYPSVPPGISGLGIGALVAGVASTLVSLLVACFGLAGADAGWGGWVAGAFAVLAVALGLAGVGLAVAALRQIGRARATGNPLGGRGLAIAGMSCGAAGALLTALALAAVLLLQLG